MKLLARFAFLLMVAGCVMSAAVGQHVVFTWTGSGNTGPTCSSTVTTSCLSGYTITQTTPSGGVVATPAITALTATIIAPVGSATPYTYSLVVNGKDQNGNAISGPAATTQVTVPVPFSIPNPPIGFSGAQTVSKAEPEFYFGPESAQIGAGVRVASEEGDFFPVGDGVSAAIAYPVNHHAHGFKAQVIASK